MRWLAQTLAFLLVCGLLLGPACSKEYESHFDSCECISQCFINYLKCSYEAENLHQWNYCYFDRNHCQMDICGGPVGSYVTCYLRCEDSQSCEAECSETYEWGATETCESFSCELDCLDVASQAKNSCVTSLQEEYGEDLLPYQEELMECYHEEVIKKVEICFDAC
jgi:hypothetical protein